MRRRTRCARCRPVRRELARDGSHRALMWALAMTVSACAHAPPIVPLTATVSDGRTVLLHRAGRTSVYSIAPASTAPGPSPRFDFDERRIVSADVVPLRTDGRESAVVVLIAEGVGDYTGSNADLIAMPDVDGAPPRALWSNGMSVSSPQGSWTASLWLVDLDHDGRYEIVRYAHGDGAMFDDQPPTSVFRARADGSFVRDDGPRARVPVDLRAFVMARVAPLVAELERRYGPVALISVSRALGRLYGTTPVGSDAEILVRHLGRDGRLETIRFIADPFDTHPRILRQEVVPQSPSHSP